jgi:peptidoglycan/xylan/chitin deacetylase (PgdA/CDA1 family)
MSAQELIITTSWDDGHPMDFRLAELLTKYNIRGTLYVPRRSQRPTINESSIRKLSQDFEIGAHTMNHISLITIPPERARPEIMDSKLWIESVTGQECKMFCFPGGKFSSVHVDAVREAGFLGARTTEFLSTSFPRPTSGVLEMPTTIQARQHRPQAYLRNTVKRAALKNLWTYVSKGWSLDWPDLAAALIRESKTHGGVFHLWGHSWEIDDQSQWSRLEDVLSFLSQFADQAVFMTNSEVCEHVALPSASKRNGVVTGSTSRATPGAP